jgi:lipopolysaccharide biosynthesis protein
MKSSSVKTIAIHLPQFHPIPENNAWWGKGFTEWTNVVKATPILKGHYQPHLPSELGFYDLRLEETRMLQAELAKEYNIYGFCYYHYWFNGKRLLNKPIDEIIASGKPDFPFMLCWANENWTRTWDGLEANVLIKQEYSAEDDEQHINFLMPIFKDPRYIKIDNKPVFMIYRSDVIPNIKATIELWRKIARMNGFEDMYLINVQYNPNTFIDPLEKNFDASMAFQPNWVQSPTRLFGTMQTKLLHKLKIKESPFAVNYIQHYETFAEHMMGLPPYPYKCYPCVTPGWDNSARKKRKGAILLDSTPEVFKKWLSHTVNTFVPYSKEENLIFINAWNEWAEGNHLEPCQKWGRAYLEAVKEATIKK